jgi:fatty-acyl-CoA synthase
VAQDGSLTEQRVRAHLQRRLASFKQPKFIDLVDSLPKNQAGKILKSVLREAEMSGVAAKLSPR